MDFTLSTSGPPVTIIRINGQEYKLPHFLLPAIAEWAAKRRKATIDEATAVYTDDDDKARFLMYFPAPLVDIADVGPWATSTEGAPLVFRHCASKAGVPADIQEAFIEQVDPMLLRTLAKDLCSAAKASATMRQMTEGDQSPLAEPQEGSQDSPGTGQPNTPASAPAIPESTQAA